jgi:penicillin-binding protein 1A
LAALVAWPLGLLLLVGLLLYIDAPLPQLRPANPSRVYSADGVLLGRLQAPGYRPAIAQSDVTPVLKNALHAADVGEGSGIANGLVNRYAQRLMRLQYDARQEERTLLRKAKEMAAALYLTHTLSADSLLTLYLNRSTFVGGQAGIESAAAALYGKPVRQLSVQQAALLMGLLKAPGQYNPFKHPQAALVRRNQVLQNMVQTAALDSLTAAKLLQTKLELSPPRAQVVPQAQAPYFMAQLPRWVQQWADQYYDSTGLTIDVNQDGLRITTTLDTRLQAHAEAAAYEHLFLLQQPLNAHLRGYEPWRKDTSFLPRLMRKTERWLAGKAAGKDYKTLVKEFSQKQAMRVVSIRWANTPGKFWLRPVLHDTLLSPADSIQYYLKLMQAAVLSADTRTGAIRAWVGGLDFLRLPLDHVAQTRRQVGSAFKPFVYGAALQTGFKVCDSLPNRPIAIQTPEGRWRPKNAEGDTGQMVSLRCALAFSVNIVTARVMDKIGPQTVADFARHAGVRTPLKAVPSLAFGTTELSLYEMVEAYTTLARMGSSMPLHAIARIEDRDGNVLYQWQPAPRTAFDPDLGYKLIDMLRDVVTYGTAGTIKRDFKLFEVDMAGKTGTTQQHADGWFMSLTPELVTGVWVGCDDARIRFAHMGMGRAAVTAMPLGGRYLSRVYEDKKIALPKGKFVAPGKIKEKLWCGECPPGIVAQTEDSLGVDKWNDLDVDDLE